MNEPNLIRKDTLTDKVINKQKRILIIAVLCVLTLFIGSSYALLTNFDKTDNVINFTTGNLNITVTNSGDSLTLTELNGKLPETDQTGLQNATPIVLTLTNTGTMNIMRYDVKLTSDATKTSTLDEKYIKYAISLDNGTTYSSPSILTENDNIIYTGYNLDVDASKIVYLKLWIDENAGNYALNKEYYGSITVDLYQKSDIPGSVTMMNAITANTDASCNPSVTDTDGTIYFSGDNTCVDFNYVWYSGKLWRITAIYPDGTMKMITDGVITTINWGSKSTVSSSDLTSAYSTSYMREWLNQEFLPTLYNYENIIVEDAGWYSITDSASTPTKPTGEYTLIDPVGLLNAYEYYMSYKNTSYTNGYLNIGYYWWLITPYSSSNVRSVNKSGLYYDNSSSLSGVVRPSINLKSTIQLFGGSGTSEDPYRIKGDIEEATANITLLNTRYSGEYIKLSSDETAPIFRIVDTELVGESLTTKIVLNDYVKESDTILTKNFSSSKSYELWTEVSASDTTYWRGYLNTTWLGTLDTSMLEKGTYYLGYYTTGSYKTTVCSTVSSDVSVKKCIENGTIVSNISSDDYVGLLRAGEMFAGQTRDYTHSNAIDIWLITPYSSSNVRGVSSSGSLFSNYSASNGFGVRPSINLKSTILIKSGSGTKQDPFVVGLASAE